MVNRRLMAHNPAMTRFVVRIWKPFHCTLHILLSSKDPAGNAKLAHVPLHESCEMHRASSPPIFARFVCVAFAPLHCSTYRNGRVNMYPRAQDHHYHRKSILYCRPGCNNSHLLKISGDIRSACLDAKNANDVIGHQLCSGMRDWKLYEVSLSADLHRLAHAACHCRRAWLPRSAASSMPLCLGIMNMMTM